MFPDQTPFRAADPYDWETLLALIQRGFAAMHGRINPPSSIHRLTAATLARSPEVWVIGAPPRACMVLTPQPDALYIGKVVVDAAHRGQGLSRRLITQAETRARALGLPALELQVRVELLENHAIYRHLGFVKHAETTHDGFSQPTSITYRKPVVP